MNCKNKIITSILLLSLFSGTLDASDEKVEKSKIVSKLESAHNVADYLGDFMLISGGLMSCIPYYDTYDWKITEDDLGKKLGRVPDAPAFPVGHFFLVLGIAEKLLISLPLNILKNIKS